MVMAMAMAMAMAMVGCGSFYPFGTDDVNRFHSDGRQADHGQIAFVIAFIHPPGKPEW